MSEMKEGMKPDDMMAMMSQMMPKMMDGMKAEDMMAMMSQMMPTMMRKRWVP